MSQREMKNSEEEEPESLEYHPEASRKILTGGNLFFSLEINTKKCVGLQ